MTSKALVEFDSWIICPKCHTAMVGEAGEECFLCGVPTVATPLYPDTPDTEAEKIVASVQRGRKAQAESEAICFELGVEYSDEEREALFELGLELFDD